MKKNYKVLILIIMTLILFTGCNSKKEEKTESNDDGTISSIISKNKFVFDSSTQLGNMIIKYDSKFSAELLQNNVILNYYENSTLMFSVNCAKTKSKNLEAAKDSYSKKYARFSSLSINGKEWINFEDSLKADEIVDSMYIVEHDGVVYRVSFPYYSEFEEFKKDFLMNISFVTSAEE